MKAGEFEVANCIADAIHELQVPSGSTALKSFLGLCNVFRPLVPNFVRIASTVSKRLGNSQPKELGPLTGEELSALETVMVKLISPPALTLPKSEEQYNLNTDACTRQIGCVPLQK